MSHPSRVSLSSGRFSSSTSGEQHTIAHAGQHPLPPYGLRHKQPSAPVALLPVRAVVVNHHMVILLKRPDACDRLSAMLPGVPT